MHEINIWQKSSNDLKHLGRKKLLRVKIDKISHKKRRVRLCVYHTHTLYTSQRLSLFSFFVTLQCGSLLNKFRFHRLLFLLLFFLVSTASNPDTLFLFLIPNERMIFCEEQRKTHSYPKYGKISVTFTINMDFYGAPFPLHGNHFEIFSCRCLFSFWLLLSVSMFQIGGIWHFFFGRCSKDLDFVPGNELLN